MTVIYAWRGEHGPAYNARPLPVTYCFQSRHASLSFGSKQVARHYALHPNTPRIDGLRSTFPRLIHAQLTINNPLISTENDSFIEMRYLIRKIGLSNAHRIAVAHAYWLQNTNLWDSEFSETYPDLQALLCSRPELLQDLYVQIYPLLDDPMVIHLLRAHGFDGAIYAGSGVFQDPEYRIFDRRQARVLQVKNLELLTAHLL